jgi:hypothetical protein
VEKTREGNAYTQLEDLSNYNVSDLDRKILVHFKYYPDLASVPGTVSQAKMSQAKSRARIKTANGMMLMTVVMCLITVIVAKSHSRQNSLVEENYRRHFKYKTGEDGSQNSRLGLVFNTKEGEDEK